MDLTSLNLPANQRPPTHPVAVTGYVLKDLQFLLLKRRNPPLIWAPPGGRLHLLEDPRQGCIREVQEETGLSVEIVGLVDYGYGQLEGHGYLLWLDFLTVVKGGNLHLSPEHAEHRWMTLQQIQNAPDFSRSDSCGFKVSDFQKAFLLWKNTCPKEGMF